jgi:hypothetical protein
MSKKADRSRQAMLAARTLHEQEWAHARWLEHRSYQQMRMMAGKPIEEGGLGYDLSLDSLRGLVAGYRATHGEQIMTKAEYIERELHDLDVAQQLALAAMQKAATDNTLDAAAVKLYADLGAQRRKLLGLDAPIEAKVDVVHRDAITEELNDMLKRAGRKPLKTESE